MPGWCGLLEGLGRGREPCVGTQRRSEASGAAEAQPASSAPGAGPAHTWVLLPVRPVSSVWGPHWVRAGS